ncbi:hypothetical protein B6I21_01185 [candidate division KSB1 bacterium 4572_119]|nr:MAG: hypothetical protein B6I21_01185 [candidate division KSB1 bacterium 4572_119]
MIFKNCEVLFFLIAPPGFDNYFLNHGSIETSIKFRIILQKLKKYLTEMKILLYYNQKYGRASIKED